MRNCFVPGCDSYCKANSCAQRKMFFAPKGENSFKIREFHKVKKFNSRNV